MGMGVWGEELMKYNLVADGWSFVLRLHTSPTPTPAVPNQCLRVLGILVVAQPCRTQDTPKIQPLLEDSPSAWLKFLQTMMQPSLLNPSLPLSLHTCQTCTVV